MTEQTVIPQRDLASFLYGVRISDFVQKHLTNDQKDLVSLFEKITYKPGYKITIRLDYEQNLDVTFELKQPDLAYPHSLGFYTDLHHRKRITHEECKRLLDLNNFFVYVTHQIKVLEIHELNEWLKFNGNHITQPHPDA